MINIIETKKDCFYIDTKLYQIPRIFRITTRRNHSSASAISRPIISAKRHNAFLESNFQPAESYPTLPRKGENSDGWRWVGAGCRKGGRQRTYVKRARKQRLVER